MNQLIFWRSLTLMSSCNCVVDKLVQNEASDRRSIYGTLILFCMSHVWLQSEIFFFLFQHLLSFTVIYNFLWSHKFFRFFPYSYGHLWNKVVIGVLFLWRSCMTYSGLIYIFLIKYVFLVKYGFWWSQTNI